MYHNALILLVVKEKDNSRVTHWNGEDKKGDYYRQAPNDLPKASGDHLGAFMGITVSTQH